MKTRLILLICITSIYSFAQTPGSLDLAFGGVGYTTTEFIGNDDQGNSTAIQSDGKIIVVGWSYPDFGLARYNTNGILDTTFGTSGKVITPVGNYTSSPNCVKIQQDGKIILVGQSIDNTGAYNQFTIVRYDTTGTLDNTFGTSGIVTTLIGSNGSVAYSLFIQQDGKIIVSGLASYGTYQTFAVVRYNSNGIIDNTFGTIGITTTHIGSGNNFAVCMAQQSDGRIVVGGYADNGLNQDIAVARYDSTGALDNTFGTSGIVTTPIGTGADIANGIAIQSDGKIVLAGWSFNGSYDKFAVVRYDNTGILDASFGTGGIVTTSLGTLNDGARAVAIESNGKIVVTGFSRNSLNKNTIAVVNYNSDGTLNSSFGTGGKTITQIGSSHAAASTIALQADGKIIVAGRAYNGANNDFMVARYNNDFTVGIKQNENENLLSVFPNPFETQTTITFKNLQTNTIIKIIDVNGREIKTIYFSGTQLVIGKGIMQSGIYFLQITDEKKNIMSRKIIVQ
jgi:uncharacterized delta-60 repeat protein